MKTIDARVIHESALGPADKCVPVQEVRLRLSRARGRKFTSETFRQWRKAAKVTSRGFYNGFECDRLVAVAIHLREGKPLKNMGLKVRIQLLLDKEKEFNESTTST